MRRASWIGALLLCACRGGSGAPGGGSAAASASTRVEQAAPPGMVWIPGGVLVAGTPKDVYPRVADAEMAGEQVVMHGFWIDEYPHPNEPGAIPITNLTQPEAAAACAEQGKRLCTELEIERACKGPSNTPFEYGASFRPEVCGMGGAAPTLQPSGLRPACASAFGVRDLHGTAATWTSSAWKRGEPERPDLFAVRGGAGPEGAVVGRCAHAFPAPGGSRRPDVGARCCFGEPNGFEVVIPVVKGRPFESLRLPEPEARELERRGRDELARRTPGAGEGWSVHHAWAWRPIGNEVIHLVAGCVEELGKKRKKRRAKPGTCLVLFARPGAGGLATLAAVPTGDWAPAVTEAERARSLWVVGADAKGAFRVTVTYAWGTLDLSPAARKTRRARGDDGVFPDER